MIDDIEPAKGSSTDGLEHRRHFGVASAFKNLVHRPVAAISAVYLAALLIAAVFAGQIAPYAPDDQNVINSLRGPSREHLLGTDTLGRDVLSRLLHGIEPTFLGALQAVIVFVILGVPIGIVAGYLRGRIDAVISRVTELLLAFPPIIIVLVVLVAFSGSTTAAMVTLGVLGAPGLIRVVRAATLAVREELFVVAARVAGVSTPRIMATHVLRRVRGPVLVQVSLFAGIAIVFQAALAFLGLTSTGGRPSWGGMVGEAAGVVVQQSWLLVPAGGAIFLTVLAFGFLGDFARDRSADDRDSAVPRSRGRRRPTARMTSPARLDVPPDAEPALLTVSGLWVYTADDTALITDVQFSLHAGETLGLAGESGCGKSLTALAVLGLLGPGLRAEGHVVFDGVDLMAGGRAAYQRVRGSGLAYISQDPMSALDPAYPVGRLLDEVIQLHHLDSRAERRSRAVQLLTDVQIEDPERVLRAYPHEISGGMAQRVAIALALAGEPLLLVADEPTTALDVTVQAEVLDVIRSLQARHDLAVLLITHDWGVVADICDRTIVMYAGEIVEQADASGIFGAPRHPYTAALLASDVSKAPTGRRLPTLSGRVPAPGGWPLGCRFASRCPDALPACRAEPVTPVATETGYARCIRLDELTAQEVGS